MVDEAVFFMVTNFIHICTNDKEANVLNVYKYLKEYMEIKSQMKEKKKA